MSTDLEKNKIAQNKKWGGLRRKSRKNKGVKKTKKAQGGRRHRKSRKNKGGIQGDPIPGVDVSIEQSPSGIRIGNVTVPGPIRIIIPGKLVQKSKTF